jgi:putative two-component system response regulator
MAKLLIVDDEPVVRELLYEFLTSKGYEVYTADNGITAVSMVRELNPHIVFLDVIMPGMGGIDALREIKRIDPSIAVIMMTAVTNKKILNKTLNLGAYDYLIKPLDLDYIDNTVTVKISDFLKRAEERLRDSYTTLQKTFDGVVKAMARVVEAKDPYTSGHQERVAKLAEAIAKEMDLSQERINAIRISAQIHDLGKIYVPSEILSKPSMLTYIEYELIKTHSQVGYEILKTIEFPYPVALIVWQHHERINGTGYPQGLKGKKIQLEAKIIAVADIVEAMASHRPYRAALSIDSALEEITAKRAVLYDSEIVDACLVLY